MKKTCLGITVSASFAGLIGLAVATILMILVLRSCIVLLDEVTGSYDEQPAGVGFFKSTGGWDYRRIPLIEPYQAISTDKETWTIDLKTNSIRATFSIGVAKLGVIDKRVIVVYDAPNAILRGERVGEAWFVIIPEENIEKGFTKEEEFLSYLEGRGIDHPKLTDVNEVYKEFFNKRHLEWFPEEHK